MPGRSRCRWPVYGLAFTAAIAPVSASAHVRWFVDDDRYPPRWELIFSLQTLLVVVTTAILLGALLILRRLVGSPHFPNPPFLAYMEPSATTLLAVQTGISLIFFASQIELFVPSLDLGSGLVTWLLVALQILVAFTFITGLFDRAGAALLAIVWLLGFVAFEFWEVLDHVLYVGIGVCLLILGRTIPPRAVARRLLPLGQYEVESVRALRILTGLSIAVVAFTEKLLVPEAGVAFLQEYPNFNFMREFLGWDWWTDYRFVIAAGVVEAAAGLLLLSGVLTRVVILVLLVPFNATVAFLPPIELLGHLPIFGIMYVLLLYGSGADPNAHERRLDPAAGEATETQIRATPGVFRPARE